MKKLIVICLSLLGLAWAGLQFGLGMSPLAMKANIEVGSAMGSKLACSARYLTGLGAEQAMDDLASYSAASRQFTIDYDDERGGVASNLQGFASTSARYRPGLGCTLDYGDTSALDAVVVPELVASSADWPLGSTVPTIEAGLQLELDEILQRDNDAGLQTRALLVVSSDGILAESYARGFDETTPLLGWSMGKSLTAIMLGHMELLGQMSVDEQALFPQWSDDERASISVEQLLQMSSGLGFDETYAPGHDATRMLFLAHSASDVALESPQLQPPGEHFYYSSGTTNLLQRLMFDRLGGLQGSVDFLYEKIFQPLAMTHSILEPDPSGVFVGSSYIYASGRDWARLGSLMLQRGTLNGVQIVDPAWVERAQSPNHSLNDKRYGYQFWLNDGEEALRWPQLPADAYAMMGNRKQVVMIIPSQDKVLVRLGWTSADYPMQENFAQLID